MLNIATIGTIKLMVAAFAVYFPTMTISGAFAAWFAKKLGDDTASEQGLASLNPLEHKNNVGLVILFLTVLLNGFSFLTFGSYIPVNEYKFHGSLKKLKYLLALWARSFANVVMSCFAIFIWICFWRLIGKPYGFAENYPSMLMSIQLLYLVFRQMNIVTALLGLISGLVRLIMSFVFPDIREESLFVLLVVEIYLVFLSWEYLAPYMGAIIRVIEENFSNFISYLIR